MSRVTLEQGLDAYHCTDSGGHYIPAACYMRWLEIQPAHLPHLLESAGETEIATDSESYTVLLCPESDTLMSRHRVGHGFTFSVKPLDHRWHQARRRRVGSPVRAEFP